MIGIWPLVGPGRATAGLLALLHLAGAVLSACGDYGTKLTYVTVSDANGVIRAVSTGGFSEEAIAETLATCDELEQAPLRASRCPP